MWLPEDTAYALGWQAELDAKCGGCGQPRDESMDPEIEGAWNVTVARCHPCAEQAKAGKQWVDNGGDPDGLYFGVTRRTT